MLLVDLCLPGGKAHTPFTLQSVKIPSLTTAAAASAGGKVERTTTSNAGKMDAFTTAEVNEIESYLVSQGQGQKNDASEDIDSPPESPVEQQQAHSGGMLGAPFPTGGNGFDPEAWHFDIHGNLISAPQAAYENMEVQQLPMPPMNPAALPPPPFYHHAPPPHMMYRPGMHPAPMGRGIPPMMAGYPRPQQPDIADMFQAQLNIGRPNHYNMKKSPTHHRGVPFCHFFAQGRCRNGSNCQFLHELPLSPTIGQASGELRKICHFFAQGRCRNGSSCRYVHEESAPSTTASTTTDVNSE